MYNFLMMIVATYILMRCSYNYYENNLLFLFWGEEGYCLSVDSTCDERLVVILTGLTFNTTE